ncbi:hypothetical protein GPECTOR_49g532 [Gonium pectorale]|uniref:Cytochrome P450 n=1 Tax=Gonium pectorale TaxID=33097 RepID=A0A150G7Z7_GONPE|nr:hypothetical protein GPECTOR_49g532 [Gonium pectorale]|eukprot:KXZ45948.1 hypothetical protein GPECTOR_49g532 [Gonium pectorale]
MHQASQLASELASQQPTHDALELSQLVAARGIVGAVVGSDEASSAASAGRPEREALERLLIAFIRVSRVPVATRDEAECNRLERAMAQAVERLADDFWSAADAAAKEKDTKKEEKDTAAATPDEGCVAPCGSPSVLGAAGTTPQLDVSVPAPPPNSHDLADGRSPPGGAQAAVPSGGPGAESASAPAAPAAPSAAVRAVLAGSSALLPRLLSQAALSRSEAVCNAHSCLLAGFETSFLLIACSLLHLASAPDLQGEVRAELRLKRPLDGGGGGRGGGGGAGSGAAAVSAPAPPLVGAILRETLRVNPPVSGLPRRVVAPEGLRVGLRAAAGEGGDGEGGSGQGCEDCARARALVLAPGMDFTVDLIAAAHSWRRHPQPATLPPGAAAAPAGAVAGAAAAGPDAAAHVALNGSGSRSGGKEERCGGVGSHNAAGRRPPGAAGPGRGGAAVNWDPASWEWDPKRPPPPAGCRDRYGEAAPFGIGPRSCPAGSLSMVLAREVLCSLMGAFAWRLERPEADRGWMSRAFTAPTLGIPGPIPLVFERTE